MIGITDGRKSVSYRSCALCKHVTKSRRGENKICPNFNITLKRKTLISDLSDPEDDVIDLVD